MKKENRKELEKIIRTAGLLAVFLVVLGLEDILFRLISNLRN